MRKNTYQLQEHKCLATDMHVQMLEPKQGIRQLRSQKICTGQLQNPITQKTLNKGSTIDEDLMSRLRYTCSRLEGSDISTDVVEQIDDELEITAAALNTRMQISGNLDTIAKPHPTTPKGIQVSEMTRPIVPPKPKQQNFKESPRHQVLNIQKDIEAVKKGKDGKGEMVSLTNHDHNFATINKFRFRLTPSSPPMIPPVRSFHVSPTSVPPDKVTEAHFQTTVKDGMTMTLTKDMSVSDYTSSSLYSAPFDDSTYEIPAAGTYNKTTNDILNRVYVMQPGSGEDPELQNTLKNASYQGDRAAN